MSGTIRELAMPYDDSHPRAMDAEPASGARPAAGNPTAERVDLERDRGDARPPRQDAPRTDAPRTDVPRTKAPKVDAPSDADDKAGGGKGGEADETKKRRSPLIWVILAVVALLAIAGGLYYYIANRNIETTDDAYTDGRAVTIAPQVSGYVVTLDINDNQFVRAGQTLLTIGPRTYIAAREQAAGQLEAAKGQLDSARAALALARITYPAKLLAAQAQVQAQQAVLTRAQQDARRQTSIARAATTQTNIDQATAGQRQAEANLAAAKADLLQAQPVATLIAQSAAQVRQLEGQVAQAQGQLDQANINIGYTTLKAPQDGWITKRNVELGNYLTAGAAVTSLVSPQVWVTANFKESQLDRMRAGQAVNIAVDAYPSLKLKGHVDSVQLGSGSRFTAFPAENATGNYVKIVQRVPVKIDIDSGLDPALPLPLGLSVEPAVSLK